MRENELYFRQVPQFVIFDLDGTIVDSSADIRSDLRAALDENRIQAPESFEDIKIGAPMPLILKELLPTLESGVLNKVLKDFRRIHDSSDMSKSHLYSGVSKLIERLRAANVELYIATNKSRAGAINSLTKFLLIDRFKYLSCFGDDGIFNKNDSVSHLVRRFKSATKNAWMIGDAVGDIQAGNANRLFTIAHLGGYGDHSELQSAKPNILIDNYEQLLIEFESIGFSNIKNKQ